MELTQPVDWLNRPCVGYVVNTEFSNENSDILGKLTEEIEAVFDNAVFCMPKSSLHITLLDWIAPLVDYDGQDKNELYASVQPDYDKAMTGILSSVKPFTVRFNELRVTPSTILIVGHDNGQFQNIREQFLEKVELLPGTNLPPQIIHSSLVRFTKPIDLDPVNSFIANKELNITQRITGFRLVRTTKEPMLEFETLKRYEL